MAKYWILILFLGVSYSAAGPPPDLEDVLPSDWDVLHKQNNGVTVVCGPDEYRCDDGRCIPTWQCSSITHCNDVCTNNSTCHQNQFECELSKKCIPSGWVCDGEPDCGRSVELGPDQSDESPSKCLHGITCPPNQARCQDLTTCIPISLFCNDVANCPDNSDEWDICSNSTCNSINCTHGCKMTYDGPSCFCLDGQKPEAGKCVDLDECTLDGSCDQICENTIGSFTCSCVNGYQLVDSTHCKGFNEPKDEETSLLFATQRDIRRVKLDGTPWPGNSTLKLLNSHALEFNFANRSICYIHNKVTKSSLSCSSIDDLNERWLMPIPAMFPELESIHQIALDWISGNWYFLDDLREVVILCNHTLDACDVLLEVDLSKPRGIALDPTRGIMFFTKWGHSAPALEQCSMNGTNRKAIVIHKIVYPYGVAVDIPSKHVYWVDTYLDFVERVDYDGNNRKTVKKGHPVQNLYSITVFEGSIFVTSWHNQSIIRLSKQNSIDHDFIISNISRPYTVHIFHKQKQPDVHHPCKIHNGGCDHLCIPAYKNNSIPYPDCICKPGYQRYSGECRLVKEQTFVIYGKGRPAMIKGITLSPKQNRQVMVPFTDLSQPTALDFDVKEEYIYYSDVQRDVISRQHIHTSKREIVFSAAKNGARSLSTCEGLAVDWISRNLYWTDETFGSVTVARLESQNFEHVKTLIQDDVSNPRAIVLHPVKGIMFWSNWAGKLKDSGKIETAWMDGTNRNIFIDTGIHWPNGLAIDHVLGKLYWCDVFLEKIEKIDIDGKNRELIMKGTEVMHPYSLAFHNGYLFWTQHQRGIVRRLNLKTSAIDTLSTEKPPLYDIKIYDTLTQASQTVNPCSQDGDKCGEFCLPTPGGAVCACSDGSKIQDKNQCVVVTNYTAPSRCPNGFFQCNQRFCIDKKYVCDGDDDCLDGKDEDTRPGGVCGNIVCQADQFRCDSNKCISNYWVCDGENDCSDKSDEDPSNCKNTTCLSTQFTCKISGRCIPLAWQCDADLDCGKGDESDEHEDCADEFPKCKITEFTCDNKNCIPSDYYCDGHDDCRDNSDESNCQTCDIKTSFMCSISDTCFPLKNKCDGITHCPDGSDEVNCTKIIEKTSSNHNNQHHQIHNKKENVLCSAHEFQCKNQNCIRKEFRCDSRVDCLDGSDEEDCTSIQSTTLSPITTTESPHCLAPSRYCDNRTRCLSVDRLCDDIIDCEDGSDEGLRCDEKLCSKVQLCSHTCHNTPKGFVCSCPPGQTLLDDKLRCSPAHPCAAWGVCSQTCQPRKNRHKCTCVDGYRLADDGFTCKSMVAATPYVIYSNRHELRGIDLQTMQVKALIASLKNTIALDFYYTPEANMIFWTDVIDDKIYRGTMIGGSLSNIEIVVQTGLSTAEGLAVDWIAQNLYWVESNLDQIEVARLNGSFRRTLVAGDMESPRAIAVDPREGLAFWTDWETSAPRIERCTLAGQSRMTVVRVDKISNGGWPNGLTLDYVSRRIYWIDARSDAIHTTTYTGSDPHEVMRGHETLSHPFAITLFENYVYWTDWRTNSLIRANKWNGSDIFILQRTYTQPFDIIIMHPSRQPKSAVNPCGNNNGGCSHLCLLDGPTTYQCACPHVMRLASDQHNCVVHEKVLLFSRQNEIRGVDLTLPYYHTIPTTSLPQVLSPQQIDFVASANTIYWADTEMHEIKKTGLTTGPIQSIIDTGIENPAGFAIDWISGIMFFSSSGSKEHISVCNLKGEYTAVVISGDNLKKVSGLAVDPTKGQLFWSHVRDNIPIIEQSNMDGTERKVLVSQDSNKHLTKPQSLVVDHFSNRLYWVNVENKTIQYYDFESNKVKTVPLPEISEPTAVVPYFDKIYYASTHDSAIHICDKTTCQNDTLLRNNTSNIMSMKIYDSALQSGNNSCQHNQGSCQHLCLPTGPYTRKCVCATGYHPHPQQPDKCVGVEEFMFYSINWEIRGLDINGNNKTDVLGPISQVSMATSVDFHAATDYIYWADSDHGTVSRVRRDGTGRQLLVEQTESVDNVPIDWLTGLAIDWIAGNMYWTDPKRNVIEVSRLNGSSRYVLFSNDLETASALAVDPLVGYLFFAGEGWIQRAQLDGSNRTLLYNRTSQSSITDITLDYTAKKIYWTDSTGQIIMGMNYDGSNPSELLNHDLDNPFALTVHDEYIFWLDTVNDRGSIKKAPVSNMSDITTLAEDVGDSLKDIQVFSKKRQRGFNPCMIPENGGCEKLCLFDGINAKCACPHGNVAPDGKKCIPYDAFLMYSRVVRVDSIHMFDESDLNAPYPTIQNREMMRNAIGLSFDYKTSRLFYTDIQRGSINSVFFNGTEHTVIVDQQGLVEGLAYDQLSDHLFWTCNSDAAINKVDVSLSLSKDRKLENPGSSDSEHPHFNDNLVQRVIKLQSGDKPRGIAVDSCQMRIYWTNWNTQIPSIQRAHTNGNGLESIITTDIRMPNGLTLDHKAQKLYWADARLDKIERSEYDGTSRVVITKGTPAHPFNIAVYGDFIFWTDWVLHAVIRADKITGLNTVRLRKDIPRPMGIIAVANDTNNCLLNKCLVENGGCSDICKLTPEGEPSCECFPGRFLDDMKKRCFSSNSTCTPGFFRCASSLCIPYESTCDGINHCDDESDENDTYCALRKCPTDMFTCTNNRCIQKSKRCNEENDCGDHSDEQFCVCDNALNNFQCNSGHCINNSLVCDVKADCPDASDEKNCQRRDCRAPGAHTAIKELPDDTLLINCNYTTPCIHPSWICDGHNDCFDNSDEENCPIVNTTEISIHGNGKCGPDKFACLQDICILEIWRCDGEDDCYDGQFRVDGISSDEAGCKHQCRQDQFTCSNGECIPASWQCDGSPDCTDGSDETMHCRDRTCSLNEFKCGDTSRCVPNAWLCDGEKDCAGGEDENITAGCEANSCDPNIHLQCVDGSCVPKLFFCDGDFDCNDKSDEPENCERPTGTEIECPPDKPFRCKAHCISLDWLCDGWDDCGDGSDEKDPRCEKGTGFCLKHEHECSNKVCINETLLCDGKNDCGDYSDETKCNINECTENPCAHTCVDLKIGYSCTCKKGYKVSENDKHLCVDVDECADNPCGQVCRNTQGSFVCSCQDGFTLNPDKVNCRANSRTPATLIFSNRYYVRTMNLATGGSTMLAHNLTNAVALDFDWAGQCIYWSDVTRFDSSIKRLCEMNSTNAGGASVNVTYQILHSSTLQNPDGLAIDWIGRNLYWCDKGLDTIEVSRLDGKHRKILHHSGLQEPRAIALDPKHGMMYWSDWGDRAHIGRSGMDGSDPTIIINTSLGWPNAISISHESRELYFADAKEDYVAVADLDGKNIRYLFSRGKNPSMNLHHIFAIAVWEGYIYWSDWETKSIVRCDRHPLVHTRNDPSMNSSLANLTLCKTMGQLVHKPMDIRIYHPYRQRPVPNRSRRCAELNCTGLCLLTPGGTDGPLATCACPENFILGEDGRSCNNNCTTAHFVCAKSLKCIPFWWRCDTQDDCGDGSDEPASCRNFSCKPGQFQCNNTQCIHPSLLCNGENDCLDGSDELDCDKFTCLSSQIKCRGNSTVNDRCIPLKKKCDGTVDCVLGDDELNCPAVTCESSHFLCKNNKCIPKIWVCDRDNDCGDNSDEGEQCNSERECSSDTFRCNSGRCIPNTWVCDGDADCPNNEDEPPACKDSSFHTCEPTYFKCNNNKCIPGRWHCDDDNDCGDSSDEEHCSPRNCSESEFKCSNNRCIRGFLRCNGEYNCDDRSDEMNCNVTCAANEFMCEYNPNFCISSEWVCDGEVDCSNGEDEANCPVTDSPTGHHHINHTCHGNMFACTTPRGRCVPDTWKCDNVDDCGDGSDEDKDMCAHSVCAPNFFRCQNHKCIPSQNTCDGVDNCGDGSDELLTFCKSLNSCGKDLFKCDNTYCISQKNVCDGQDDCGDSSDEINCHKSSCVLGYCSQICIEKKENHFFCKCDVGYQPQIYGNFTSCEAEDTQARLVVSSDSGLRIFNPYKAGDEYIQLIYRKSEHPFYKIDALDFLWNDNETLLFWVEIDKRRIPQATIESMILSIETETFHPKNELFISGLTNPKSVAVEWISRKLYWTDTGKTPHTGHIGASTLDGRMRTTLIKDLHEPMDIIIDIFTQQIIWSLVGTPSIEIATLSGSRRRVLVSKNIRWPSGLAYDAPAKRIYWADPKTDTLESIKIDGTDRQIIRQFSFNEKPFKVAIFEDYSYIATYYGQGILKVDKFGREKHKITFLVRGLNKASDMILLHQNMQYKNVSNACVSHPCHHSALCLLSTEPPGRSCICPDELISTGLSYNGSVLCTVRKSVLVSCSLRCAGGGTCEAVDGTERCACAPGYMGTRCERYHCATRCLHGGTCSPQTSGRVGPSRQFKCDCPPQWTGERCEISLLKCAGGCLNGGICTGDGCRCPNPYSGKKCELCGKDKECLNGGTCLYAPHKTQSATCRCSAGWVGSNCSTSACKSFCANDDFCKINADGQPECHCPQNKSGARCEEDMCKNFCKNGGACHFTKDRVVCACPVHYTGPRCEENICPPGGDCEHTVDETESKMSKDDNICDFNTNGSRYCKNQGQCTETAHGNVCRCPLQWNGPYCEVYIGHDNPCVDRCKNYGICSMHVLGAPPRCHCLEGWRGEFCGTKDACWNYCHPFNGVCRIGLNDKPECICLGGYGGLQCNESPQQLAGAHERRMWTGVGVSLFLLFLVAAVFAVLFVIYKRRGGKAFSHSRLQDNLEISNPMYMQGNNDEDMDPLERGFVLDPDKNGSHFANPVYDSMYAGSGGSGGGSSAVGSLANSLSGPAADERAGLLQNVQESDPLS